MGIKAPNPPSPYPPKGPYDFILTGYAQSQLQTFASVSEKYPAPAIPAGWAFSIHGPSSTFGSAS